MDKKAKAIHNGKTLVSISMPLELLHLDLFNSYEIASLIDSKYLSNYHWWLYVNFIKNKVETLKQG